MASTNVYDFDDRRLITIKYRFDAKGKLLFIAAAVICLISVFLAPAGIIFIYMALVAEIRIDDNALTYRMLRKRVVPFSDMSSITIGKPQRAAYYIDVDPGGYQTISFATVIPMVIELRYGRKVKLSLNYFENPRGIIETLRDKTGFTVLDANGDAVPF